MREANEMSEVPTLTNLVVALALSSGCLIFRVRQGSASWNIGRGWPDLTLVKDGRLIFAELKKQRAEVPAHQQRWLDALAATGAEVYVWRPLDLLDGTIQSILEEKP